MAPIKAPMIMNKTPRTMAQRALVLICRGRSLPPETRLIAVFAFVRRRSCSVRWAWSGPVTRNPLSPYCACGSP